MDARASRTPTFGRGLGLPTLFAIIALPGIAHETWIIVACGFGLLVTLLNDLKLPVFPCHGPGPPGGPVVSQGLDITRADSTRSMDKATGRGSPRGVRFAHARASAHCQRFQAADNARSPATQWQRRRTHCVPGHTGINVAAARPGRRGAKCTGSPDEPPGGQRAGPCCRTHTTQPSASGRRCIPLSSSTSWIADHAVHTRARARVRL
jgi:hypothetical protein